ncbi:MAG: large repetitive protein, partial [Actinomycetota bacterium]|nr:large repetitive protein [Actinomycetota bacterium]
MLSAKPTVLRRLAAGLVVGLVGTLGAYVAGASPASAAGINEPPVLPHSVIVFPVRDFVSADGLTVGQNYVIEDWRAGVRVGVSEPITAARPSGLVEVNHPGGGCWTGVTPDIRPGDRVVVHPEADAATGDATTTSNVVVTQPATKDPANPSVVTVKGTAADASGAPLPIGAIEARIVANKQAFVLNGRRTLRAPGDGALAYDAPGSTAWTATFTGLDGVSSVDQLSDADRAVSAGAESRGLWLGINPGTTAEGTIYEFGQIGGPSAPCTAPLATGPSTPDMTAASDTGSSNADNVTNNPTPAFSGVTGNAGATSVNLYVDGTLSGSTATIGAGGTFTVSPDLAIADGAHAVRFGEVVGGVETQSASALQITVDTAAPAAPTVTGTVPAATGSSTAPAVTGTSDAGTTVQVRGDALCTSAVLGSGSAAAFASPGLSATASPGALSTYYAQATDLAGNVSTCSSTSASYRQDSVPPPDPIIDAASTTGLVASTSATFAFSDSEAAVTYQCAVDGAAFAACTSPKAYSALGQGAHSFAVRAVDAAANVSTVATRAWTADTVAPTTDITSPVGTTVNNPAPVFHFTASEAGSTFQCSLDGSPAATCVDGKTYPAAADGPHTFQVTATDQAGNVGPTATYHFTIDTAVPPVTLDGTPPNPTNDNTPTFTYSSPKAGVVFTCAFAPVGRVSPVFSSCPGGTFTSSALTDGTYAFTVRATDAAGNVGSATSQLTIDTAAPAAPTITSKPAVNSAVAQPSFGFTAEPGASFQCSLTPSAAVAAPCGTGEQYGPLADGAYTFKVFAKDAAGNVSLTTSYAFTVDTTAPTATISAGPSGLTKGTSQSFTFSANEAAATKCQLAPVEQTFTACTSPKSYPALADGAYTFQVLATDTAGNVSQAASRSFTVDSTAPVVTLVTKPASLTKDPSPVFSYSSSETATGSCSLVTSGSADLFTPCASTIGYTGKADGTYRFTAKATDAAGNTGTSASYTFTIDTAAPVVTINTQPTSPTNNPSATFGFTTEAGATLFCSLEAQGAAQNFTPCSSPVTYPGLANGTYSFAVQAADAAGNVSTTTPRTFTVDSTAPVVTLTTKPA